MSTINASRLEFLNTFFDGTHAPDLAYFQSERRKEARRQTGRMIFFALFVAIVIASLVCKAEPIAPSVWAQPTNTFATWKARGVATIFDYPRDRDTSISSDGTGSITVSQWADAADAAGLQYFLPWNASTIPLIVGPGARKGVAGVIVANDEPNGSGGQTPDQCQRNRDAIRAAGFRGLLVIDLDFAACRYQDDATIAGYCAAADRIYGDLYPTNRGEGESGIIDLVVQVNRAIRLSGGKPVVAWIETSNQNLKVTEWGRQSDPSGTRMRGPIVQEWWNEIVAVNNAGASVGWFPDVIGANFESFDGTSDGIAAEMIRAYGPRTPTSPPPRPPTIATPAATTQPAPPVVEITVKVNGVIYTPAKP